MNGRLFQAAAFIKCWLFGNCRRDMRAREVFCLKLAAAASVPLMTIVAEDECSVVFHVRDDEFHESHARSCFPLFVDCCRGTTTYIFRRFIIFII